MLAAWQLRMLKRSAHKLFISHTIHATGIFTLILEYMILRGNVGQYTKKIIECLGYGSSKPGLSSRCSFCIKDGNVLRVSSETNSLSIHITPVVVAGN